MNPAGMMKPRPIEGEPMPAENAAPAQDAQYTDSSERCATCAHFDGESGCAKGVNGGAVEPMGHCNQWEGGDPVESEGSPESAAVEVGQ